MADNDALVAASKLRIQPETIAAIRSLYEDTAEPLRKVAARLRVSYGWIIILARAYDWKKRRTYRSDKIRRDTQAAAPTRGTAAKPKPHPKMRHPIVEARQYDPPTLAAITRLQQRGFVVYQTRPGEFMVGTKRLDHAGMMAKAERYGAAVGSVL